MAKPALGRGLGALLGGSLPAARLVIPTAAPLTATDLPTAPSTDVGEQVRRVALERVRPCPFQPRKEFAPEALQELADSIKEQGDEPLHNEEAMDQLAQRRKNQRILP